MKQDVLYQALRSQFDESEAHKIVEQVASLENQNTERLKEIFITKEEFFRSQQELRKDLLDKIDSKVDKIYWFILGQTVVLVGLLLAIMKAAGTF